MKRFIEGQGRDQATLFPECLEDWIDEDNTVCVVDAYVDGLDLGLLGEGHRLVDDAATVLRTGQIRDDDTGDTARRGGGLLERFALAERGEVLSTGRSIGQRIGSGPARLVQDVADMGSVRPGDVLVTDMTDPDWEPVMKRAAAIVTDHGGRTRRPG